MSRYTGPAYKRSRRVGISTLENGKELVKKPYGPGQHGNGRRKMFFNGNYLRSSNWIYNWWRRIFQLKRIALWNAPFRVDIIKKDF